MSSGVVKKLTYQRNEKPCGGNTRYCVSLKETGMITRMGARMNK